MSLTVRGDNVTALTMVRNLKAGSPALAKIARLMALDMADAEYAPDLAQHTPGIQNVIPDVLSRKYDPTHRTCFHFSFASPTMLSQRRGPCRGGVRSICSADYRGTPSAEIGQIGTLGGRGLGTWQGSKTTRPDSVVRSACPCLGVHFETSAPHSVFGCVLR